MKSYCQNLIPGPTPMHYLLLFVFVKGKNNKGHAYINSRANGQANR